MLAASARSWLQNDTNVQSRTPQQMQHMQNLRAASANGQMMQNNSQMERSNSQMDNRTTSPGSGDAPSPKRQRLEGGMQQMGQGRPGQPGQMPQATQQVGPTPSLIPKPHLHNHVRARASRALSPSKWTQYLLNCCTSPRCNRLTRRLLLYRNTLSPCRGRRRRE